MRRVVILLAQFPCVGKTPGHLDAFFFTVSQGKTAFGDRPQRNASLAQTMLPKLTSYIIALAAHAVVAFGSTYDESIARGKALIEARDYEGAMQQLKTAAAADGTRHEAFLQLAVVSYRTEDLSSAEEYAKSSLARAPEAEALAIREVLGVINDKRKFMRLEQDGNEAFSQGLMAKAADTYRQAYELFPNRGAVGLRAATLYGDSLNRLLDAAILWEKVAASEDRESAGIAREELNRRNADLVALATTRLAAAKQASNIPELVRLTQAFPTNLGVRFETAAAFAGNADVANTTMHLAAANKLGLKPNALVPRKEFQALLTSTQTKAAFARFVNDAYGEETAVSMRAEKQRVDAEAAAARVAAKRAAETARLTAERKARDERVRRTAETARLTAERQAREERARREREAAARRNSQPIRTYNPPPPPPIRQPSNTSASGIR